MSTQETVATVRRYYDVLTTQSDHADGLDVVATDAIFREPGRLLQGREAFRQSASDFKTAFPDLRCTIDDLVAADEKAVVRWTITGTHLGTFGPYAATGKQVTLSGIAIHRVANGQVVEGWGCFDTLGASLQLGAVLTMPEPSSSISQRPGAGVIPR
jgi:steroid delta-isomerase-like uncharacterized protein